LYRFALSRETLLASAASPWTGDCARAQSPPATAVRVPGIQQGGPETSSNDGCSTVQSQQEFETSSDA
jgi:hypothetical protein